MSSDLKDSYKRVKAYLKDGRRVLFSGTPCQVAGLKSFLGDDPEMLLTVDLVCHGVPSQKLFRKYIQWLGEKKGSPIKSFCFRSKKFYGWSLGGECSDGKKAYAVNPDCDPYYAAFLRGETFRKSCYSCKFANMNREGDFTLSLQQRLQQLQQSSRLRKRKSATISSIQALTALLFVIIFPPL